MKTRFANIYVTALTTIAFVAQADVLELKNNRILTGKYVGGSAGTIRFETSKGVEVIETSQALALTFTASGSQAAAPPSATGVPAAAATPVAPAPAPTTVSIPAGTTLTVRMLDGASSNDAKGKRFTTTLETDLIVQGRVVAKAGTRVYGRVENAERARRYAGKSSLDLRLTDLTVGGSFVPIVTGQYAQAGEASLRKTGRGAAAEPQSERLPTVEKGPSKERRLALLPRDSKKARPSWFQPARSWIFSSRSLSAFLSPHNITSTPGRLVYETQNFEIALGGRLITRCLVGGG